MIVTDTTDLSPRELDERFDLLVADVREYAIFLVGQDGSIRCWNPGAERLFGYTSPEIIGQHFSRLFSPEDVRSGQPEHELKAALDTSHAVSVRWQIRKDGTRFWCQATTTPLFDESKQVRSFARVMHDLTEGQAQEAQRKRADDLAEANRSKEEFMALLAHELRSPLSPILSALNVQRQMKTDDPILQQAGDIIERQVGLMVRLVDDLLDIGRITKGKLRLSKERVELRVLVNRAAEAARPTIDCRKHEFSVSLPTEPIWVQADAVRLEQVIVNLLNNAAKYTDPGGLIRLSVSSADGEAVLKVWDNGLGVPPEMLPRIFDLFTQVDATLSRSHGGLGVGLALVRTLVEMHDGRVQAYSAGPNQGSEFTVILPALASIPADHAKVVLERLPPTGPSLRILVVEDNIDAGDGLSLLLRMHGHEVLVARTGPSALEVASAFGPHVVLLDIGLPGLDGFQVAQRLRERPEFTNVVLCALSGYTPSDADRDRSQQAGFDHLRQAREFQGTIQIARFGNAAPAAAQCWTQELRPMPTGKIIQLVHLSQQTYQPNTRLVPDRNDKGYGTIEDDAGREIYFSHEMIAGRHGFDDLRRGQVLEYTLEDAPYLRAASVAVARAVPADVLRPAA
jgi:PAS domain S-box-containing protein